jgi:hypothetical protein
MKRLVTVHEFVDQCDRKCLTEKERCVRYTSVKTYIPHMETRHEQRRDCVPCDATNRRPIRL